MLRIIQTDGRARRSAWWLSCLIGVWTAAGAQQPQAQDIAAPFAKHPVPAYKVINLGAGCPIHQASINGKGQVAFSMDNGNGYRGFFYDGKTIADIGTLDGTFTIARAMNNLGQVVGASGAHAFLWSRKSGILDLGVLPGGDSSDAAAINNLGQVTGTARFIAPSNQTYHAFRWTPAHGMEDLGSLTGRYSTGLSINDSGVIVGGSDSPGDALHGFLWTRAAGMMDLGTLGGNFSLARVISPAGQVAGESNTSDDPQAHAFLWSRRSGMKDLGTAGGIGSLVVAMSPNENIAGIVLHANNSRHAMAWSRSRGMTDLGTFGGKNSEAKAVNSKGQVVGFSEMQSGKRHAFLWTPGQGMVDLNKRLKHRPPGFELESAIAIADDGTIVAAGAGGGLVLLKPCDCHAAAETELE